tara:strand:- start:1114 stop:1395 length:282 start_codon:yes stop_codon:yes gene_type:complete
MVTIQKILNENKEGIIIGAIAGYVIGSFFLPESVQLNVVADSFGIIDNLKQASTTALEFAKTKVVVATTIIGATLGFVIDNQMKEGFLRGLIK